MDFTPYEIADILGIDKGLIVESSLNIHHVSIDSRDANIDSSTLFCALDGSNSNGHLYIKKCIDRGVKNFLVNRIPPDVSTEKANFFLVENVLSSLQKLASEHRQKLDLTVIGITGSNGKTIVKEWLYQCISPYRKTYKSPASYNSQIGVALSILGIKSWHDIAIIEAGISMPNEMDALQKMIRPSIGIFTNIGDSHQNNFSTIDQKINEKIKLFKETKFIICKNIYKKNLLNSNAKVIDWGQDNSAKYSISTINKIDNSTIIALNIEGEKHRLNLPFSIDSSIENAMNCITTMLALNFSTSHIQQSIIKLIDVPMRMELKSGINNCIIIDDSYSFDTDSLRIAVQRLKDFGDDYDKSIILSDFDAQSISSTAYQEVSTIIKNLNLKRIITIGTKLSESFGNIPHKNYINTDALFSSFNKNDFANEVILIKGARKYQLEKISIALTQVTNRTFLEINLSALRHNINRYKSNMENHVLLMAVVKASGYGSGTKLMHAFLQNSPVDYLGVAILREAIDLRNGAVNKPILIFNPAPENLHKIYEYNLDLELSNFKMLDHILQFSNHQELRIQIKIDTGMNRMGFKENDIDPLLEKLSNLKLHITGIFTHLSASEDAGSDDFSIKQLELFDKIYARICKTLQISPIKHALNSSGTMRFRNHHYDMVRIGLGLYGINESSHELQSEAVHKLASNILQIKQIQKGERIGYGSNTIVDKKTKIAMIGLGYADGLIRLAGNGNFSVKINGALAPLIGNICMDICMADVSQITDVYEGQEVIIFDDYKSISRLANACQTIPYEILSRISERVDRLYTY